MNKQQLCIDVSKYETEEDLIKIRFHDDDILQVNFSKLISQSKYIRDKYKYSEALSSIQNEIERIEEEFGISDKSIKFFIQLVQNNKINIPLEHFKDIYSLSEYFSISKIKTELDHIIEQDLFTELNFSIQILIDFKGSQNSFDTKLAIKIENFLSDRINECIENPKFQEIPFSTLFRIFSKSSEKVDHNLLIDFILKSAEERFILIKFVELQKLRGEKIDELIKFIEKQEEETKKKYLEYIPFDLSYIKYIKSQYDQVLNEMNRAKEELKKEIKNHEKTKEELNQCKKELKKSKNLSKIEYEIIVAGFDNSNGLGEKPNNKAKDGFNPIISPPVKISFSSPLLSYSIYCDHSIIVSNDGQLKAIGFNDDGRITSLLQKSNIDHFTLFSIKDSNGLLLDPLSAVCCLFSTLYMFKKIKGNGNFLVFCDKDIKGGDPVFLDIGVQNPVALFGGCVHSAAIGSKGEVIFINRYSLLKSPDSKIQPFFLPEGEKASTIACCENSVVVLSLNGRVFELPIEFNDNENPTFSEVYELKGKKIVSLSGTNKHCIAVTNEGHAFGRGSNEEGQLGLGKEIETSSSFVEISSLDGYEIRDAYAGDLHSLFVTNEGKVLSCGSNECGQLLLKCGKGENVFSPVETTIDGGATFCVAGFGLSSVFVGNSPPPNTPNTRILHY